MELLHCDGCGMPVLSEEAKYLRDLLGKLYDEPLYTMKCVACVKKALEKEIKDGDQSQGQNRVDTKE